MIFVGLFGSFVARLALFHFLMRLRRGVQHPLERLVEVVVFFRIRHDQYHSSSALLPHCHQGTALRHIKLDQQLVRDSRRTLYPVLSGPRRGDSCMGYRRKYPVWCCRPYYPSSELGRANQSLRQSNNVSNKTGFRRCSSARFIRGRCDNGRMGSAIQ